MLKVISTTEDGKYTRRVQARSYDRTISVFVGDKRTSRRNERFDFTRVELTREEIAKLAKLFPVEVSPKVKREASRDMRADMSPAIAAEYY